MRLRDVLRPRHKLTGPFRCLLVTDIDGTIIDRSGIVSEDTLGGIGRLKEASWDVVVATGRLLGTAAPYIDAVGSHSLPSIVYDGGRIMHRSGQVLWEKRLSSSLVRQVLSAGWDRGMEVQIMEDEFVKCRPQDARTMYFLDLMKIPYRCDLTCPEVDSDDVFRVMFFDPERRSIGATASLMREAVGGQVEIVQAGDGFLDILPAGVSKGAALSRWLALTGRSYDLIVAVGDNENDLELLKAADYAVAISTGPDDLLEAADLIVSPPAENGIAKLADILLKNII